MAVKIKLMADYGCYPLWWASSDRAGDIDPETLPLSKETISRLEKWAEIYDAKLNWENPGDSVGFCSLEAEAAFENEGINLWKQLQKELFPNYEVIYFSNKLRKVVTAPNELEALLFRNYLYLLRAKFSKLQRKSIAKLALKRSQTEHSKQL